MSAGAADAADAAAWQLAATALVARARSSAKLIVVAALIGAAAAVALKSVLPPSYKATAELIVDPRGLKVFADDLSSGQMDANAAINFVESQMAVMRSDRVLLRVVRERGLAASEVGGATETADTRALAKLQRNIAVVRAERSFVVDVTATAVSPDTAAQLANAIVDAYLAEDAIDRSAVAKRLTGELSSRLETLRAALRAAETKAEAYRVDNGLVGAQDRLVVEQRLTEATTALSAAQSREAQARARLKQLSAEPLDSSSLGLPGNDPDSRRLASLMERQAMARGDLAQLSATLGARHPAIESARNRVVEVDAAIRDALANVRKAAKADVERAQSETAALTRNLAALTGDVAAVRRAEVELRALERDVESSRKILDSFETRARETSEFGQIDRSFTRVVSPARAPNTSSGLVALGVWGIAGAVMAAILTLGGFAIQLMLSPAPAKPELPALPVAQPQSRVRRRLVALPATAGLADAAGEPAPASEPMPRPTAKPIAATAVYSAGPASLEPVPTKAAAGSARDPRIVMVRPPAPTLPPPIFAARALRRHGTRGPAVARAEPQPAAEMGRMPMAPAGSQPPGPPSPRGPWRFLS